MKKKIKTALVTGGNGNLGRLVADALIGRDIEVIKFDLPGTAPRDIRSGETIVSGDIRDHALLDSVLAQHRPDAVYHLASLLSGSSETDLDAAWEINAGASFQLLRLAVKYNIGTFFFASTVATYGGVLPHPMPEDAPQWPQNMYGVTKVAVERLGTYFKTRHDLDFRCLRFPMVISPYAPATALTAYPSHAFRAAFDGQPFVFPVSPGVGMSTMFLDDVIKGIVDFTLAQRSRLTRHVYDLHAYFVSAQMVADEIRRRYPDFSFSFVPIASIERLIANWPDEMPDRGARTDWGWHPRYDFPGTASRMFEVLG